MAARRKTDAPPGVDRAVELLLAGRRDEAVGILERCAREGSEVGAATSLLAQLAADSGRLEDAVELARRAIGLDPLNPGPYYVLALVATDQNRLEEAVSHLRRAIYLEPHFVAAHLLLGVLAHLRGQPEAARRHEELARDFLAGGLAATPMSHHVVLTTAELGEAAMGWTAPRKAAPR